MKKQNSHILQIEKLWIFHVLLLIGILFLINDLHAQGSPYDFIGFGDPVITQTPRLEGLAGAGVASTEPRTINDQNPAAWSMLTRARIEARLGFTYLKSDLLNDEGIKRTVKFGGATFATPLWEKNHFGFSLGFSPLTNVDAEAQTVDSNETTTLYSREGGLSQLYIGLSFRPISALNIGGRADFLFGNIRTIILTTIQGEETAPGYFQREYSLSGSRGTFGFLLTLDSIVEELHGLTIGGAYSMATSLNSNKRTIITPVNSLLDSTIEIPGFGYYPSLIRLGIAARFGNRYRVEADISGQDFSNASVYSSSSTIIGDPQLSSSNRVALGIERLPIMGDEAKGLGTWERAGLRLGASYATLPFRPDTKMTVHEMSVTGGIGIPLNYESLFDFSVSLGLRTPQNVDIAPKDFFFKMGASISLSEKWFVPLRRGDDE